MSKAAIRCARVACWGLLLGVLGGCVGSWKQTGHYEQLRETRLDVESEPAADLYVNGEFVARTPASTLLRYREGVTIEERRVHMLMQDPGESLAVTVATYGLGFPLLLLPVTFESRDQPSGSFVDAEFEVELRRDGYQPWARTLTPRGEEWTEFEATLSPLSPDAEALEEPAP